MYEIAVNALEFKSEAEVVKISHTYLPDKITGEVIMTKPISCCEFWKIFANNKRAIKEGMVVNGRKISDVEYCRSEDNQCKFLFEASYGKGYNNE
jgi:hypothetical protein